MEYDHDGRTQIFTKDVPRHMPKGCGNSIGCIGETDFILKSKHQLNKALPVLTMWS